MISYHSVCIIFVFLCVQKKKNQPFMLDFNFHKLTSMLNIDLLILSIFFDSINDGYIEVESIIAKTE